LESPSTFLFKVQDIAAIATIARNHNIRTILDNSWATPLYQNPIDHGIDLVVHSLSKYISGHSDVVGGAIIGSQDALDQIGKRESSLLGGTMSPMQAWLAIRGLRTLQMRVERHRENTRKVVDMLLSHPAVERIYYPGSPSYTQRELADKYLSGFTGLLSFSIRGNKESVISFTNRLRLFRIGCSWGGFESLVMPVAALSLPILQPSASGVEGQYDDIGGTLIRLSVGLEDPDDLIADLKQALGPNHTENDNP